MKKILMTALVSIVSVSGAHAWVLDVTNNSNAKVAITLEFPSSGNSNHEVDPGVALSLDAFTCPKKIIVKSLSGPGADQERIFQPACLNNKSALAITPAGNVTFTN